MGSAWVCLHLYFVRRWAKTVVDLIQGLAFLLTLCPRNETVFSELGKYTLYPFLLHFSLLLWLHKIVLLLNLPVSTSFVVHLLFAIGFGIPACIGITWLLTTWPVRKLFGLVLEPTWLHSMLAKPNEHTTGDSKAAKLLENEREH